MSDAITTSAGGGPKVPVARSVGGFALAPGETVALDLSPTRADGLITGAGAGGLIWAVFVVSFLSRLGGPDPLSLRQFGILTLVALAMGFLVALFSTAHRTRLVATDRGLHVRRNDGSDAEFIPWADVVSVEPAGLGTAVWRVHLRPGAPGITKASWLQRLASLGRDASDVYVVGDENLYDFGGRRLEEVQAAHDRWLEGELKE